MVEVPALIGHECAKAMFRDLMLAEPFVEMYSPVFEVLMRGMLDVAGVQNEEQAAFEYFRNVFDPGNVAPDLDLAAFSRIPFRGDVSDIDSQIARLAQYAGRIVGGIAASTLESSQDARPMTATRREAADESLDEYLHQRVSDEEDGDWVLALQRAGLGDLARALRESDDAI